MHLDQASAQRFIATYQPILLTIAGEASADESTYLAMHQGRKALSEDPTQLDIAIAQLQAKGVALDEQVLAAIRQLQAGPWVYLRDTSTYSVFLDPHGKSAYGVLGLTQRLRDILGDSGAVLETGLLPYQGRLICDAVIANVVWIGSGYRQSFNADLKRLRQQKRFSTTALAPASTPAGKHQRARRQAADNKR